MNDGNLLELLDIYITMTEKQGEVISKLSETVKKQAYEIEHFRNMYELSGGKDTE